MKPIISLFAVITLSIVAWQATPHIKVVSKQEPSRIESVQPAKTATIPPVVQTPVTAAPEQPKIVNPATPGTCDLAYKYDWPARTARAVCWAESTNNVMSTNMKDNHGVCRGSFSLMQVGCFWYPFYGYSEADYYNAEINMQIAYNIWKRQGGFQAWTTYTGGQYLKFL